MKAIIALVIISLYAGSSAEAQKRKKKPSRPSSTKSQPTSAVTRPRIIGSTVVIVTKNGDRISGEVLDLTAYSIRLRSSNLESSIALDTIASLSFGGAAVSSARADHPEGAARADFARDAESAIGFFQTLASNLKAGTDYAEYTRQLTELRRAAERFIAKYSSADNSAEARAVSLLAGALTDYSWARIIWTLKFGRSSDGTIGDTDSPIVTDTIALYPDLRTTAAAGNRLSAEKLIAGLWRKASEKTDRARALMASSR